VGTDCLKKYSRLPKVIIDAIKRTDRKKKGYVHLDDYDKCKYCELYYIWDTYEVSSYGYCNHCVENFPNDINLTFRNCKVCKCKFQCKKNETFKDKCKNCFVKYMNSITTQKCINYKSCHSIYQLKRNEIRWRNKCPECYLKTKPRYL
jgi:hypothetical protein